VAADTWTDERLATLKTMWADGYSGTRIALALGVTRNSVIGKLNRLQLEAPRHKLPIITDRVYTRQHPDVTREKRNAYQRRYFKEKRERKWAAIGHPPPARSQRRPVMQEMTKGELRAMLAQAMQNTAALQ